MTRTSGKTHTESEAHWLEWLTGLICAAIVLAMIAWMGFQAWRHSSAPPELSVRILEVAPSGANYRVSIEVANAATSTAASVSVRGEILRDGTPIESSDVTFDYVPSESAVAGALLFRNDPAGGALRVLAMGYTEP